MTADVLVTAEWVAAHLADDGVVVAEVDEDPHLYAEGHIPGAVALHWRDDLQDRLVRDVVAKEAFESLLALRGMGAETTIVLYGDKSNCFAAFAYWSLKRYGHADVRILDGGRQTWIDEGRDLTTDVPAPAPARYLAREADESIRARRDDVLAGLGAESRVLVDVRSSQEYRGELVAPPGYEQDGVTRAGHIPTALSIPWSQAVRDDGTFKPVDELRELYRGIGVTPDREVVAYCRTGERSAHTWFVLRELLGYPEVKSYDGSWAEWGNLVGVPVERSP